MAALFSRKANRIIRRALAAGVVILLAAPIALMAWVRTPLATGQTEEIEQPVPFSHTIHAGALHIDCRYCHDLAERSATAGVPPTERCVPCHSQLWMSSEPMAPVRTSLATGKPIPWKRVHALADFVYFDHSIHLKKGVGCESCHGRVDQMDVLRQVAPLTMGWCLQCHRDPAPSLRPAEAITAMGWTPSEPAGRLAARLVAQNHVRANTDCSACHR